MTLMTAELVRNMRLMGAKSISDLSSENIRFRAV
jgi:isopentenyl diphosphate isomerase/L-lactate dehydrogenase-like FMN-dependent dehydrogenase